MNVPQHDPVYKATIIPRGRALGLVMSVPERDTYSVSKTKYTSQIAMAMAGKAAEIIKFGEDNVSSGPVSDIQQVSKIARAMVTQFGMSDKIGNVNYSTEQESFLGSYQGGGMQISGDTQAVIEEEVKRLIDEGYQTAYRILTEKNVEFERLAQGLIEYETLTGDEIKKVIAGEPLNRDEDGGSDGGNKPLTSVPKTKGKPKSDGGMEPTPA
jgi:cell division protease FtsH